MRFFDQNATCEALPFKSLIESLRSTFRGGCSVPDRHVHSIKGLTGQGTSLIMPAWNGQYFGVKTVNVFPGNASLSRPALHSTYQLFDANTGVPIAQMDGDVITARRTAAASALAASYLARATAKRLLVVGAGRVASLLPEAYLEVFDLDEIAVWSRDRSKLAAMVQTLRCKGLNVIEAGDLAEGVRRADIVSCATLATIPIVQGAWLRPGSHLDLIGSFTPEMREADDDAFTCAHVFVDTEEALKKSGDLLGPFATGALARSDIRGTLRELCLGIRPWRSDVGVRTIFKSVGTALEDLAAAIQVYEHCDSLPDE
ncbi:ornithine cyclodeaminase family protein [Variovorax sp. HW608]|uniref:ornithine cyclodeaminase family protein n=1 Tax=Variovorax sp. HW608 TaxID=1034889 RepID=UPI000B5AD12E|nr:ornithine cyclodeaminase family protein [Variovorax sp. HW608]